MGQTDQFDQATKWLERVNTYLERRKGESDSTTLAISISQRMIPLQIIVLAGRDQSTEAERLLKSLTTSPAVLLSVIVGLDQFASVKPAPERARIADLQVKVAERLGQHREELSLVQRSHLDQSLARAFITTHQTVKALEILKRLADSSTKDLDKQRELAKQLSEMTDQGAITLGRQCWRRVEALTKPGSLEWLSARLGALQATVQLNQAEEARKLLQVTKVLYPDLGGEPFAKQFEAVERELQSRK